LEALLKNKIQIKTHQKIKNKLTKTLKDRKNDKNT
jgi:hypothetical protein